MWGEMNAIRKAKKSLLWKNKARMKRKAKTTNYKILTVRQKPAKNYFRATERPIK